MQVIFGGFSLYVGGTEKVDECGKKSEMSHNACTDSDYMRWGASGSPCSLV